MPSSGRPRWKLLVLGLGAGAVVLIAVLALVPVTHTFSAQLRSGWLSDGTEVLTFPIGSHISGSWRAAYGTVITLTIYPVGGAVFFSENASNGTFAFSAQASSYVFTSSSTSVHNVTTFITGSYSAPLLIL